MSGPVENLIEWLWSGTLCRVRLHSPPSWRPLKFNGGNPVRLCKFCRLILTYEREEP